MRMRCGKLRRRAVSLLAAIGTCRSSGAAPISALYEAAEASSANLLSTLLGGEPNEDSSARRRLETVKHGTWGVYGGAPAEKRCDSFLFTGQFACCWKNRMTAILAKRERTRYRWVCNSDPSELDCTKVEVPGNASLYEEPHACRRHVTNYVEYGFKMMLYYVLYSTATPVVLDDSIAQNCSAAIRHGTASLLNVSLQSVEILSGPTLTSAMHQDGARVQALSVSLRFVPDYDLVRLYKAAVAEGNRTAANTYNHTLENIQAAISSENALTNASALDDYLTRSLRMMGSALSHVNIEGLNVTTSKRNQMGEVIRHTVTGEVSKAHRANAGHVLWLISALLIVVVDEKMKLKASTHVMAF